MDVLNNISITFMLRRGVDRPIRVLARVHEEGNAAICTRRMIEYLDLSDLNALEPIVFLIVVGRIDREMIL
jgi:hypothetical protein